MIINVRKMRKLHRRKDKYAKKSTDEERNRREQLMKEIHKEHIRSYVPPEPDKPVRRLKFIGIRTTEVASASNTQP